MDEINSTEQQLLYIKQKKTKKLQKFYNTYLLTAKVNETHQADLYYPVCPKPIRKNNNYSIYANHLSSKVMRICRNDDIVWNLMKTLNNGLAEKIPTCSAYNSISAHKKPTQTHCILPIIQGTPTDWSNLYLATAASAKLNVNIGRSSKTILSLDLQLYMKCIQL